MMSSKRNTVASSKKKKCHPNDKITINVGGIKQEAFRSTLLHFPDTRLGWLASTDLKNAENYDEDKKEFFFDRQPRAFEYILNFYRTGKLHSPRDICGPMFQDELLFWGIEERLMEPCCWGHFTQHREAQESCKLVFERDEYERSDEASPTLPMTDTSPSDQYDSQPETVVKTFNRLKASWSKWRSFIWTLTDGNYNHKYSKIVAAVSLLFIVLACVSVCLYSVAEGNRSKLSKEDAESIEMTQNLMDIICAAWFFFEFTVRLVCCPDIKEFLKSGFNWIDFVSWIPYPLTLANRSNSNFRPLSILRMLRLFKFFKFSIGLQVLKFTLVASMMELLMFLAVITIPVLIFSTIIFYCERNSSGQHFSSIPESFWWAVVTMTTVGYGDMVPTSTLGKVVGACCACCATLIIALPVSIIGNNFTTFYSYAQARLKLPRRDRRLLIDMNKALLVGSASDSGSDGEREDGDETGTERQDGDDQPPEGSSGRLTRNSKAASQRDSRGRLSLYSSGFSTPSEMTRFRRRETVALHMAQRGSILHQVKEDSESLKSYKQGNASVHGRQRLESGVGSLSSFAMQENDKGLSLSSISTHSRINMGTTVRHEKSASHSHSSHERDPDSRYQTHFYLASQASTQENITLEPIDPKERPQAGSVVNMPDSPNDCLTPVESNFPTGVS